MISYPNIPDGLYTRLKAVEDSAKGVEGYLDDPSCPYPKDVKLYLRRLIQPEGSVGRGVDDLIDHVEVFEETGNNFDAVLGEVQATIEEMKGLERNKDLQTADRIALIRAKTTLLERWSGLKERIFTLKEMAEFQEMVIQTMESVLSVDQRAEFKEKLQKFRTVAG